MNAYKTPCNPHDCDNYDISEDCKMKSVCPKRITYLGVKDAMRHENDMQAQSYDQRSKGVDRIYKSLRGNKHRVGQI